jgi:hypothetical protein
LWSRGAARYSCFRRLPPRACRSWTT